ncbi:unnamed protein product, partial [Meganyctiphanes norvegica]
YRYGLLDFMRALQLRQNFLAPYDAILKNWMQAKDVLVSLAARTNVLVWPQGRKRECVAFDHIRSKHFEISDILYHHMLSGEAMAWNEKAMHESLKNTGVTLWDSLLPFNLANIRECEAIREVLQITDLRDDGNISSKYAQQRRKKRTSQNVIIHKSSSDDRTTEERRITGDTIAPVEYVWNKFISKGKEKGFYHNSLNESFQKSFNIRNKRNVNIIR